MERFENSIYVFSLENGKYYVGITNDLPNLLEHLPENDWLKENKFLEIEEVQKGDYLDGQKLLLKYMALHGIDNVRGMKHISKVIPRKEYLSFLREIYAYKDVCEACGKDSHEITACNEEICFVCHKPRPGRTLGPQGSDCKDEVHHASGGYASGGYGGFNGCTRCGRESHWAFRCNRSKDIYGRELKKCSLM